MQPPFANTAHSHIFRFTYEGAPQPLKAFLLERYRPGRDARWAETFYPHRVRLNDEAVDDATVVHPGDRVAYCHLRSEEPVLREALTPLHEDDWLLALHKPDAVPVNPSGVYYFTSIAVAARERFDNAELTPLHRLDIETGGVLLLARRRKEVRHFHRMFRQHTVRKRYRALVHGRFPPERTRIAGRIVPDERSRIITRLRLAPAEAHDERATVTLVHRVVHHDGFSEVEVEPVTGKTNQLRVHLAHVGHPIVGDKKYHPDEEVFLDWYAHRDFGRLQEALLLPRQALQCELMAFPHPFTGETTCVQALPGSWAAKVQPLVRSVLPPPQGPWEATP